MTVIYPSASVSVNYNRTARNLVSVTANGTNQTSATEIPSGYEWTIAVVSSSPGNTAVKFPADAEIGDAVEVHATGGGLLIFPPSGSSIGDFSANVSSALQPNNGRIYRKVTSTNWRGTVYGAGE